MLQVLSLADVLDHRIDLFTFNRLAMVGEGAALASVEPDQYRGFLKSYINAAASNKTIHLKDNLCNLQLYSEGASLQGGCPAVSFGFGQDIFNDLNPYCFKDALS